MRALAALHRVEGLPEWLEWGYRGLVLLLAIACVGMLLGLLSQRAAVSRGVWWVGVACLLFCLREAVVSLTTPPSLEGAVSLPALLALAHGIRLRLKDDSIVVVRPRTDT